jgi:two-component system, LuxR family, response regulator FixJ
MIGDPVVHIVDDDEDLRRSLAFLLDCVGVPARTHSDGAAFLAALDPDEPAIVIVDVRMPRMSGFDLQRELAERGYPAPVVFCSAHGDIPMTVRALTHGAVDFLEKPYDPQKILDVVQHHQRCAGRRFAEAAARRDLIRRLEQLTQRERDVLRLVVDGAPSQVIAHRLGVSVKTIDVHRARIKAKTGAESITVLVRDVLTHRVDV